MVGNISSWNKNSNIVKCWDQSLKKLNQSKKKQINFQFKSKVWCYGGFIVYWTKYYLIVTNNGIVFLMKFLLLKHNNNNNMNLTMVTFFCDFFSRSNLCSCL